MSFKEYQPPGITPLVYTSSGSKDFWLDLLGGTQMQTINPQTTYSPQILLPKCHNVPGNVSLYAAFTESYIYIGA